MLKIRLQRVGRKHEPTFRVVLTDSKNSTKSGRFLEVLGSHDPRRKSATELDIEKIKYWMTKGAKPTPTLHNMFISKKIIEGKKINVLPKKTVAKKEEPAVEIKAAPAAAKAEPAVETPELAAEVAETSAQEQAAQ